MASDDSSVKRTAGRMYVAIRSLDQSENRKNVSDGIIYGKKWVGTGISHPKSEIFTYAEIESTGTGQGEFAACSAYDDGLNKPSGTPHSLNEYMLYSWQDFAAHTPEGLALEQAVEPKYPLTEFPLKAQDLYEKSWCNYQFNTKADRSGGLGVIVYTFLGNRLVWSFFNDGDKVDFTGHRMETRFTSRNSVQTKTLQRTDDDYQYRPEYFRQRDASGRDYLNEGSPSKGADALPMIVPCNDEKVFALHPEWREWVAKIREMQLKALKEPNDGEINFDFVEPYIDEHGAPQFKPIPKDSTRSQFN